MNIEEQLDRIEQLALMAAKDVFTTEEAARYLGVSKAYLYKLVCKKQIPYYKGEGGKLTYFDRAELNAWMKAHRVKTVEEAEAAAAAYCVAHPMRGGARVAKNVNV